MCVYLRVKFEVSSITLTSFRQGGNFTLHHLKTNPSKPTQIRVQYSTIAAKGRREIKVNENMVLNAPLKTLSFNSFIVNENMNDNNQDSDCKFFHESLFFS